MIEEGKEKKLIFIMINKTLNILMMTSMRIKGEGDENGDNVEEGERLNQKTGRYIWVNRILIDYSFPFIS